MAAYESSGGLSDEGFPDLGERVLSFPGDEQQQQHEDDDALGPVDVIEDLSGIWSGHSRPYDPGKSETTWRNTLISFERDSALSAENNTPVYHVHGSGLSLWKGSEIEFTLDGRFFRRSNTLSLLKSHTGKYTNKVPYECVLDTAAQTLKGSYRGGTIELRRESALNNYAAPLHAREDKKAAEEDKEEDEELFVSMSSGSGRRPGPAHIRRTSSQSSSMGVVENDRNLKRTWESILRGLGGKWRGVSVRTSTGEETVWCGCHLVFNRLKDGVWTVSGGGHSLWRRESIQFKVSGQFSGTFLSGTLKKQHLGKYTNTLDYTFDVNPHKGVINGRYANGTLRLTRLPGQQDAFDDDSKDDFGGLGVLPPTLQRVASAPAGPSREVSGASSTSGSRSSERSRVEFDKRVEKYKFYLGGIIASKRITPKQFKALDAFRDQHDITDPAHEEALRLLGVTEQQFRAMRVEEVQDDADSCKICYDKRINCVLLPCGHLAICTDCSKDLQQCPVCRTNITKVQVIYRA